MHHKVNTSLAKAKQEVYKALLLGKSVKLKGVCSRSRNDRVSRWYRDLTQAQAGMDCTDSCEPYSLSFPCLPLSFGIGVVLNNFCSSLISCVCQLHQQPKSRCDIIYILISTLRKPSTSESEELDRVHNTKRQQIDR